ncbi:DUF2497 domain-containing protein [Lichenicola sp.]|uniref:DUF2497 domain-containing protein n=1 Tax=Lichenicola sp. TaxID=2804529 RepID=UPI003B00B07E
MADLPGFPADPSDGSMETILASIRRIIREDEGGPAPVTTAEEDELLVLQPSMRVQPTSSEESVMAVESVVPAPTGAKSAAELAASLFDDDEPVAVVAFREPAALPVVQAPPPPPPAAFDPAAFASQSLALQTIAEPGPRPVPAAASGPVLGAAASPLIAPETRAAAAQSLAALQDAFRPEPAPLSALRLLRSGGPTIEDMVREELAVQLKAWLDANLPALVERVVRQEIEQLVQRPV